MFYFPLSNFIIPSSPINILAKLNESLSVICWLILCKCNVWGETLLKWQQTQALGALNQATKTLISWSHNFVNVRKKDVFWNLLRMSDWMLRLAVVMKRTRQMRIRRWWHPLPVLDTFIGCAEIFPLIFCVGNRSFGRLLLSYILRHGLN